jgi:hypothetical protein
MKRGAEAEGIGDSRTQPPKEASSFLIPRDCLPTVAHGSSLAESEVA